MATADPPRSTPSGTSTAIAIVDAAVAVADTQVDTELVDTGRRGKCLREKGDTACDSAAAIVAAIPSDLWDISCDPAYAVKTWQTYLRFPWSGPCQVTHDDVAKRHSVRCPIDSPKKNWKEDAAEARRSLVSCSALPKRRDQDTKPCSADERLCCVTIGEVWGGGESGEAYVECTLTH